MIFIKKLGYLAQRKKVEINDRGKEIEYFEKPFSFYSRYMPLEEETSLKDYGIDIYKILRVYLNINEWYGKIKENDRAYLINSTTSENDIVEMVKNSNEFCTNANYRVKTVAVQNFKLKVEFEKIGEGE